MKFLKTFEIYREKPEIDEKTIRVDGKDRGWYIDIYFDSNDKVDYIDNPWQIKLPDWYGLSVNDKVIKFWADRYDSRSNVYYLLQNNMKKYNL